MSLLRPCESVAALALAIVCCGSAYGFNYGNQQVPDFFDIQPEEVHEGGFQQVIHHSFGGSSQMEMMKDLVPDPLSQSHQFLEHEMETHDIQQSDLPHEIQADPHYVSGAFGQSWSKMKSMKQFSLGSCSTRLTTPMNSALKCSTYSGCQASCKRGYTFPSGETQIYFVCDNGKWRVKGSGDDTIPQCKPTCIPPCQHGGTCVSPNTCDCPESFSGPYCQYEHKRCLGFPPIPNNARQVCNSESCTVTCLDKHQFPDGSGIANVFCKEGAWTPGRPDWLAIPDCKPVCVPECQNGGSCLAFNMCNCPQQFRGPYCQYSVDACDFRKLNFNGNYNCSEAGGMYSCSLSCPGGMDFETSPSPQYSCLYSEGVFSPASVPQCVFSGEQESSDLELVFAHGKGHLISETDIKSKHRGRKFKTSDLSVGYSDLVKHLFVLEAKSPTPGTCFSWAGFHYKTFDGRVISFKSGCTYTLASDVVDNSFQIQTSAHNCSATSCTLAVSVYVNDKNYQLTLDDGGLPVVKSNSRQWPAPSQLADLRTEIVGYSVVATLQNLGVSLRWNLQDEVEVKVSEALWNRTGGLCGRMDGHATNDLESVEDSVVGYANKWQSDTPSERCTTPVEEDACLDSASQQSAHQFCTRLMVDKRFDSCRKILPTRQYYEACRWDFCSCRDGEQQTCGCRSIGMFVRDCLQKGEKSVVNWRDEDSCPVKCNGGRIYRACGPTAVATCMTEESALVNEACEEGCYCPDGMRLHEGRCIPRDQCPCYLRGKAFPSGHKVAKGCNTCECVGGKWSCTEAECEARCAAIGDPHYTTFDGRRYNFMGKCAYTLLQTSNYTVDAENIACDGSISESLGFSVAAGASPSCTKAVTITLGDQVVKLKQNKEVTVNNEDVESLPVSVGGAYIRIASSMFIQVELSDGLEVWWDGQTRVYITAPPSLKGNTKGLCGTFNRNQKDDFLTPEGDVEQDAVAFANKWKTREVCDNSEVGTTGPSHPCDKHVSRRKLAESHCANITSSLFADCHYLVDPAPFYEDCLFDVCSCGGTTPQCLCPVMASYAKECSFQGATIEWRDKVKECGIQCPNGQQYQSCGSTCERSCEDLGRQCPRHWSCVEGCYCPAGQTLGPVGDCVPVAACACVHHGMEYPPAHKEIRPGTKGLQFCECKNGKWQCSLATPEQIREYPNQSLELRTSCSATRHQEFTHCEPPEPVTCKNMHAPPQSSPTICRSGCVCRRGYVLDSITKQCVKPAQCPCHHGGQSYSDGTKIQEDCNTCTCDGGKWNCSQRQCPGMCRAWGDSHFRTFDDRIFDFQGACDYMLAKGSLSDTDSFNVALEIVPCGSSGVSCSKSVTLSVGSGDKHETITFKAGKNVPSVLGLNRITVRQAGLFVFAEVADLGIVLQWDKGTRVILKADSKWKGRLKGLCGNYNGDEKDDFQTPSGGISEVSAQLFGDSWRLQPYCPDAHPVIDTCKFHPTRRSWAVKKCGILKSPLFRPCHSEVPIEPYLDRCIFDTCGCDQGGDCECLCTALAAYAQECNSHGVHIKWRSQQLCPIQCDESCSEYKPCIETCPLETCDNVLVYKSLSGLCQQDICVEGCDVKPCPEGQVHHNLTDLRCVPVAECKSVCMTVDGKQYFEGDFMEGDDCYSCYCSRHKKTCTGQPCTSPSPTTTTSSVAPALDQSVCVSGWSEWMSNDQPIPGKKETDVEPLPSLQQFKLSGGVKGVKKRVSSVQCGLEMMKDIECRVVGSKQHYKDTMQDVECSLENGLVCRGECHDYEIRVLCQCGPTSTSSTTVTTTTTTTPKTTEVFTTMPTTLTDAPTTLATTILQKEVEVVTCDVLAPLSAHPGDCRRYYQCVETDQGLEKMERECAPMLWYNPETMNCDWPEQVKLVRPECQVTETKPLCEDSWSEWVNVSHPSSDNGDLETFTKIAEAGITLCPGPNGFIKDIQCQYKAAVTGKVISKKGGKKSVKKGKSGWVEKDYRESPDVEVVCSPVTGLSCLNYKQDDGQCEDYSIRVLCACEHKEEETIVEQGKTEEPVTNPVGEGCRSDEQWIDCNLQCDQLCLYYEHVMLVEGKCTTGRKCVPGCWPQGSVSGCPPGFRWREWGSCVRVDDCTCRSATGAIVKPGEVIHESDCKVCICENNHYTCDDSACRITTSTTEQPTTTTTVPTVLVVPSTVSPPPPCDQERLTPLLTKLPESALSASSSQQGHEPNSGRLKVGGGASTKWEEESAGWQPVQSREGEYLQVDLGVVEPVYGVWVAGSKDLHVTSYQILYSTDNITYSHVSVYGLPEIFRGSLTGEPLVQLFSTPVEARYVRVLPQSWSGSVSMRLELLGCGEPSTPQPTTEPTTTTTVVPTTLAPVCTDEMGFDSGTLSPHQVSVSSAKQPLFAVRDAALSGERGWIPLLSSPSEWIQFDLTSERVLTGVKTRGSPEAIEGMYEPAWVTSYRVTYSHDGQSWNVILTPDGTEKVFLANYDSSSVYTNYFDKPVHARYIRVYPNTWHNIPALRIEVLGCFLPYPAVTTEEVPTTVTPNPLCNVCEGAPSVSPCPCAPEAWWDGEQCTNRTLCPCYVGHIPYAVGATYDTEDCDQCICSLNGQPRCSKKVCSSCVEGLQAVLTSTCGCVCKPCPEGSKLCPTSNVCINSTVWCDGVVDCPDDEVDCTTTTITTTTTTAKLTTVVTTPAPVARLKECPIVECPAGFEVVYTSHRNQTEPGFMEPQWSKWSSMFRGVKGGVKRGVKGGQRREKPTKIKTVLVCPEYKCVPLKPKEESCPVPKCAEDYDLKMLEAQTDKCPEYRCEQRHIPDGKCNVTGRTFDTFDGTEYKYDICDHTLAQDMVSKQWQIKLKKICPYVGSCSRALLVSQPNHKLQFNEDLTITYNGYSYSVSQMQKIGSQTRDFALKQVSNKFIIFASLLDFTIVWDVQGNVKITVPGNARGQVDGLCGFFDGHADNDRRRPDGSLARSTQEFGDSWGDNSCETLVCPLHVQNKAWEMCSVIKKEPLAQCEGAISLDKAVAQCVESVCACEERNTTSAATCRCEALLGVVTQCQAARPDVDLHLWRLHHDCPVECRAPLVYQECYSRVCEPSCADLLTEDPCPAAPAQCFPGCYCPAGLVREGNQCVKPADCRDCVCDGFGKTRFVTFDRVDFTFNGNCTHVLAKTVDGSQAPKFKVLVTSGVCADDSGETCVKSVTVIFQGHTVLLSGSNTNQTALVDGSKVNLPVDLGWVGLGVTASKDLTLAVPEAELDLVFHGVDLGFSLRLPSHVYKDNTEGLCGSCNNNQTDDLKTSLGEVTEDADKFGKSWRARDLPAVLGKEEQCSVIVNNNTCTLPPPENDFCMKLMDEAIFGRCHAVVDPWPYVELCHQSYCRHNLAGCKDLEPYARECQTAGVCVSWRSPQLCPYLCPPGLEYKACGLGCDITCDNVDLFTKDPAACTNPLSEACVCPDNKVWKNNSCVAQSRCQPCDVEGHYPGDTWHPDVCTSCTCQVGNSVQCQRTQCPATVTICERGFKSIVVQGTEAECCPKYICVPEPKGELATCPPPQQPVCGYGQVLKIETSSSGCQEFICQCLPSDECPDISDLMVFTAEAGMHAVLNTSGCCPRVDEVCRPDTCPPPPACQAFEELASRDVERCCPQYRCEPPKEKCLYEMEFIEVPEGGERKRSPSEKFTVAKKEGDVWDDGPCRVCKCESPGWRAKCSVQQCPPPPDSEDFVIQGVPKPKHCCSEYHRTACRHGGKVYKEGEVFQPLDGDLCKNITCLRTESGDLTLYETAETCNKACALGWEYTEPVFSQRCCGECRPVACLVNGTLHQRSSSWQSEDNCTTFTCDITGKQVQVISSQEQCPSVTDCPEERQYKDGCCTKCNMTVGQAQSSCMPEPLPANETLRLVRVVLPSHGVCENYNAITGFTECQGTCDSYTFYSRESDSHESQCKCCQAMQYSTINVSLMCEDGFFVEKEVSVPSKCGCESCGESPKTKGKPAKFVKA